MNLDITASDLRIIRATISAAAADAERHNMKGLSAVYDDLLDSLPELVEAITLGGDPLGPLDRHEAAALNAEAAEERDGWHR
jgi:hypothetical protein